MFQQELRQVYSKLPKQHKLALASALGLVTLLVIWPTESQSGNPLGGEPNAPGQRVSIPLPNSVTDLAENQTVYELAPSSTVPVGDVAMSVASIPKASTDIAEPEDVVEPTTTAIEEGASLEIAKVETTTSELEPAGIGQEKIELTIDELMHLDSLEPGIRYPLALDQSQIPEPEQLFDNFQPEWENHTVRRGDTLAKLFSRAGFSAQEVHHVSRAGNYAKKLLRIMPGDELRLLPSESGGFAELEYEHSPTQTLRVYRDGSRFKSEMVTKEVYSRLNYASGEITSNFWNAGVRAGMTDNQIMSLATIFGWDIDFALDIRKGDHFNVIYEENYIDGEFVGYGDIVAAEFTNQGEQFAAIRYTDGNYYTPEGRSMRKSFLRAPVNFKYISSNFNPRRFHPVQKRIKPHNGIDYAADVGTPVMSAGDGRVTASGYNRFNGNYVFIQHGDTYVTKYLHLHKRNVKKGQWVKQGQNIGQVGRTGMVTGAHLHYEFLVNGKHKNPRTVKLPKALPIAKKEKQAFLAIAREYQSKLDNNRRIMLAMNLQTAR